MKDSIIDFGRYKYHINSVPSHLAHGYRIDIINDFDSLKSIEAEWNELASVNDVEPWQSFNWVKAAAAAFSKDHLLRIITIRKKGRLSAVAPLVFKPSAQPFKPWHIDILGGEELKEPNRLISNDDVSLRMLIDIILSEPVYPIRLSRLIGDREIIHSLPQKFRQHGWITRVMSMPYPYIDLAGNKIKKSLKSDLRRARKKAEKYGELRLERVDGISEHELPAYLNRLFQIEACGWKGRNNTALLCNEPRKCFFEEYAHSSLRDGTLRLYFLLINGNAAAFQYAIETMNDFWLLNIGYDESFRNCSPGNLLLEESIKQATQNGLGRYNFLGKEEAWTKRWTQTTQPCFILAAYRPNLCGLRAMMSDALFLTLKRLKDRRVKVHKKRG